MPESEKSEIKYILSRYYIRCYSICSLQIKTAWPLSIFYQNKHQFTILILYCYSKQYYNVDSKKYSLITGMIIVQRSNRSEYLRGRVISEFCILYLNVFNLREFNKWHKQLDLSDGVANPGEYNLKIFD